jgi:hypothetical protein
MRRGLLCGIFLATTAAAGHAAADPLRDAAFRSSAPAAAPEPSAPARDFGMPTTAVERRFGRDGVTGAAGFLCGLQPKAMTDGAAAAHGVDPHGRFLGVKLHLAFR